MVLAVLLAGCGAASNERASGPALSVTTQGLTTIGPAAERELRTKADHAGVALPGEKLTFCYGWSEDAHPCLLHVGSQQACASLRPCLWATG